MVTIKFTSVENVQINDNEQFCENSSNDFTQRFYFFNKRQVSATTTNPFGNKDAAEF